MKLTSFGLVAVLTAGLVVACEDEPPIARRTKSSRPAASATQALDGGAEAQLPGIEIQEAEFAESEKSRDPFRSYVRVFADEESGKVKSQRQVVLSEYSLEELKLVAIVTGIHPAKAMLVDPAGKGHVIRRGQFVGRPDAIQGSPGSPSYELNWRVDRIRPGDVVLVREDPQNSEAPSATRVLTLHSEGAVAQQ